MVVVKQSFVGRYVAGIAVVIALGSGVGSAYAVEPYQEYRKLIETAQNLTALKDDLFGESISLYNGQTEFSVADVSIPGNNALPVEMRRRFSVEMDLVGAGNFNANLNNMGGWEVDVPHITGMFPGVNGWAANRCSGHMVPQVPSTVRLTDIWQGNVIHIPGSGNRPMLGALAGAPAPTDGVTRKWATSQLDAIDCIPMRAGLDGEGFRIKTTAGTSYYFDTATTRFAGVLNKSGGVGSITRITRARIYLLASKIEDPSGNWVQYQYDANGNPVRIWSSDGREIGMTYDGIRLASVSAGGRTWTYGYGQVEEQPRLTSVTLPDGSSWTYSYSSALQAWADLPIWDGNSTSDCAEQPPERPGELILTAHHPAGAVGQFVFGNGRQYRSGVHASECAQRINSAHELTYELVVPNFFDVVSLTSKTISGPGISEPLHWTYGYGNGYEPLWGTSGGAARYPCTDCKQEKQVVVANPDGTKAVYRYGTQYALNEGRLLGSSILNASGATLRTMSTLHMTTDEAAAQPFPQTYGLIYGGDDPSTAQIRPVVAESVEQDEVHYQTTMLAFDSLARPTRINSSSAMGSRTEALEYADSRTLWILGQQSRRTNEETGAVVESTDFDELMRPIQVRAFGRLDQVLTYNQDGTVASVADGQGNLTRLEAWKRGSPQQITFADGTTQNAEIDDNGWVKSIVDENGASTHYGYDAMGRIASIDWPAGDSVAWAQTTQRFSLINGDEYGIGAGHWRQTVATGSARKDVYFDAFWRPLVTEEYDASNRAQTLRFQRFAYDKSGRQVFASYPGATDALSTGTWRDYDALGRSTSVSIDSEHGVLTSTTTFLSGGDIRSTDARGNTSITRFQAFGAPSTDTPVSIAQSEGVFTDINRDIFGKPVAIVRRNQDGTTQIRRDYIYNAHQQLCKTVEPETGATLMGYDGAGNLAWSAAGIDLGAGNGCEADAGLASGRVVARQYDARNRLSKLLFPDQNGDQEFSYTPDGKPKAVFTRNDGGATQAINTFSYNKRGLLTGETSSDSELAVQSLGYGYDALGALAGITYPSGRYVDYSPNALGQPTRAGGYATAVTYYPNGGMRQFTYGNGLVHTMSQNARQLPSHVTDGGGALDGTYSYDANGNVISIVDNLDATKTRLMAYDGLDRLVEASSPAFGGDGVFRYTYDAVDNIRSATLTGVKDHQYWYDVKNRLVNVQNSGGATTIGLTYDPQGNLLSRNGVGYRFDFGNRLRSVSGAEGYRYDAQGRRILSKALDGRGAVRSLYGNDGVLRRQDNAREGTVTEYIHLNGSVVAEATVVVTPAIPSVTAMVVGDTSISVEWSAVAGASIYELRQQVEAGQWTTVFSGASTNWSVSSAPTGTFGYSARACRMDTCSEWSATSSVVVQRPPAGAASLSAPQFAYEGVYTVSWSEVPGAVSYQLQESSDGSTWVTVQDDARRSSEFTSKPAGTYYYRVVACNSKGCGPQSVPASTTVINRPTTAPSISAPAESLDGSYVVSVGTAYAATGYALEESVDGNAWSQVSTSGTTQFSSKYTGNYSYRVRGRNDAGWGPYSAVVTVMVIRAPAVPELWAPATSNTGSVTVQWSAVAMAVTYLLDESAAGGTFTAVQNDGSTYSTRSGLGFATYAYRVRACNRAGCSGFSNVATVTSTPPPATPQILKSLQTRWRIGGLGKLRCEMSWTAPVGAVSYQLQVPGGSLQYDGPATSVSATTGSFCAPDHVIRACNSSGCSPWSSPPFVQVINDLGTLDEGDTGVPR